MSRGKRYSREKKLNVKKVIGCILVLVALALFIIAINKILNKEDNTIKKFDISYNLIYQNNKWGVIDNSGKLIIDPTFNEMIQIPNPKVPIFICTYDVDYENGTYKTKVLNDKKQEMLKEYSLITALNNFNDKEYWYESDILKFKREDKFGLLDYTGKVVLEPEYDNIIPMQGYKNSLVITKGSEIGICNNSGKIIVEPGEYQEFKKVNIENAVIFKKDNKYGITGVNGIVLTNKYDDIKTFSTLDLFVVKQDNKWRMYNRENVEVLADKYDDFAGVNNNYIIVKEDNKYGVINTLGEIKVEIKYKDITYLEEINCLECAIEGETDKDIYNKNLEKVANGIILSINVDKAYVKMKEENEDKYYNLAFEPKTNIEEIEKIKEREEKANFIGDWNKVVSDKLVYFIK